MDNKELTDIVTVCLECQDLDKAWKSYKDSSKPYKGLYVEAQLTHSDKIINRRIYFKDKVAQAAQTFLRPYRKPVLRHHDDDDKKDAIGRVIRADYVDTCGATVQGPERAGLSRFGDLTQPRIREAYFNFLMDNYLLDPEFQGTGYIKGALDITDKKAIEKVMDERYLTLSVGFDSNSRRCSFCGHDWVRHGHPCEHMPGSVEDGLPILHLMGDLHYKEVSFVNFPADTGAQVTKIGTDAIDPAFCVYEVDTFSERFQYFKDHMEDINMFEEFIAALQAGQKVKVEDFLACENFDNARFYGLLDVPEKHRLASGDIEALDNTAFCHAGKILPLIDKAHFDAAKKFLQNCEETPGKQRITNRVYYLARKLALLPTTPADLVINEETRYPMGNEDSLISTYIELSKDNAFETYPAAKELFEERMKVLNVDYEFLNAELAKIQASQTDTEEAVSDVAEEKPEETTTEETAAQQDTEAPEDGATNKGLDANELYTIFMNLDESQQEEFRSLTDIHSGELLQLNDMVAELRKNLRTATDESVKIKSDLNTTSEKLAKATECLIDSIIDYRAMLEKPGAADREMNKAELSKRSFDSLLDTISDLRKEIADGLVDSDAPVTETDSRRNEEESEQSKYPTEPLKYSDFTNTFFGSMRF